jgi:putative peptidoglycan lipid II flippase
MTGVHGGAASTIVTNSRAPVDVPIQIFPVALSIAIFPFLSDYFAKGRTDRLFDILAKAVRIIFLVFLPLTVALLLLAHPLIAVVFGGGKYTPEDVRMTAAAAQWYSLGYVFFGLEIVLLQFFYAARNTITPTWTGILTSALQIGILWLTVDTMATSSFNMAYAASKALKVALLFALLARVYRDAKLWKTMLAHALPAVGKVALATAAMAAAVWGLMLVVPAGRNAAGIAGLAVVAAAGFAVYAAAVHVLGVEEWHDALGWVKKRVRR